MKVQAFEHAIFVRDGKNSIRELECIDDALAFLGSWPQSRRGPIYQSAYRACQAVREERLHLDGARNALLCFARSAGVLEHAPVSIEPWMIAPRNGRGGILA
ncbi:DUF982 domain-containing protein [Aminobacter anthyllidis]|uniref:DUF982 domain-containing protein n=1 Tax=Aminobacter anthyllidis TaxID=1035067 RepID=A0A9X1AH19_9HYPH|nr:DUF982 domain-containing protein [Aminobacter anthyllidis]MBT1159396.1 DUF982 domain-containing protein [Aminobacter anthyllidis]